MTDDEIAEVQLSPEERKEIIARLSEAKTEEFITRQEEIVTASVEDVRSKYPRQKGVKETSERKNQRKKYACTRYGKDFGLAGGAYNYCVAIQFDAMNKANREIGAQLKDDLHGQLPETDSLVKNPLYLKDYNDYQFKNPVCKRDTTRCEEARSCPMTLSKYNSGGFVDNPSAGASLKVSQLVDANGQVRKDENGAPKLKDGDLLFVRTGPAGNTSSGLHCIRANVSEDGKVTYTAGNGDHVKSNMRDWSRYSVAVFHTSEYAEKCFEHQFERLNDKELLQLQSQLESGDESRQQAETPSKQAENIQEDLPAQPNEEVAQVSPAGRPENVEQLAASMSAGHSAMSERIAAFRQRRNAESIERADIVAGMRADNARLQQRREELAGMRGETAEPRREFQFETKRFKCEDIADAAKQTERQNETSQRQQSGLQKFMSFFSRSEYA